MTNLQKHLLLERLREFGQEDKIKQAFSNHDTETAYGILEHLCIYLTKQEFGKEHRKYL